MIIETYRNQPIKTVFSVIFIVLGIITIAKYQEIEVTTIESVVNLILNKEMNEVFYKTLGFNITTVVGLLVVAVFWAKSAIKQDWYYEYTVINRGINVINAVILVAFALVFIVYLFKKLTGFILVAGIILLIILGNDNSQKRRRY